MAPAASTPRPPYYAVIFTSERTPGGNGYEETAGRMLDLAREQPGFLGFETARSDTGISVSYWRDLDAIKAWKHNAEHLRAQASGRDNWYASYKVRVARVEREYGNPGSAPSV